MNVDPTPADLTDWQAQQDWIVFRYAEILLNRAEAACELFAEGETDAEYLQDALSCINDIRDRAGAKQLISSINELTDIDVVRLDRRKELGFENHTWWDFIRWRNADKMINHNHYKTFAPYYVYDENNPDTSTITKITSDYEKYSGLSTIMASQGLTSGTFYMYMKNGVAYYTSENDLDSTAFEVVDGKNMYYGSYTFDYQGAQKTVENVHAKAALTQDSSGRLMSIQILDCDDADLVGNTYSITTASEDDQAAYEDAMNEYYYQKQLYEREVERINQKTETLQKEDRSLEMQLNQLDTEQKAISTEMESISKVIEDTIHSVCKTYNS